MNKTIPTGASVSAFIAAVPDETRRSDSEALVELMQEVTGNQAQMWGDSIVGFGDYTLTYASGRKVQWLEVGFSPRKAALTIYLTMSLESVEGLLAKLGPHKTGVGCLYIKKLSDVDLDVLRALVATSMEATRKMAKDQGVEPN